MKNRVTFSSAKMLRGTNFKEFVDAAFLDGVLQQLAYSIDSPLTRRLVLAPTRRQVIDWLYENHRVWIWCHPWKDHAADTNDPYEVRMNVFFNGVTVSKEFDSLQEAEDAAIDYALATILNCKPS